MRVNAQLVKVKLVVTSRPLWKLQDSFKWLISTLSHTVMLEKLLDLQVIGISLANMVLPSANTTWSRHVLLTTLKLTTTWRPLNSSHALKAMILLLITTQLLQHALLKLNLKTLMIFLHATRDPKEINLNTCSLKPLKLSAHLTNTFHGLLPTESTLTRSKTKLGQTSSPTFAKTTLEIPEPLLATKHSQKSMWLKIWKSVINQTHSLLKKESWNHSFNELRISKYQILNLKESKKINSEKHLN